ncbi:MAG: 50S ribosomal protein L11 methyltransferase [Lentisphaeria bacterium]|nr:50S ribosomal protein L11 methyltransferase [Lentisphaeria bacterium]
MIAEVLYCVSFIDESEGNGSGAEFLSAFDYSISTWKDEESGQIRQTLYFLTPEEADEAFDFVRKNADEWRSFDIVFRDFERHDLPKENWAEVWKIHFKPLEISPRLLVRPSWENVEQKEGQIQLILDPGMSFGTGQHATTKFCLASIDEFLQKANRPLTVLDAGAGSGILAIAATLLGCAKPVRAFDIDPDTIPVAKENAERNGIAPSDIEFAVSALDDYQSDMQYDIVAANILSSALIAGREKLLSLTKPGGYLVLAGILATEYDRVKAAFEELGCKELRTTQEKEWRGGAFLVPVNR